MDINTSLNQKYSINSVRNGSVNKLVMCKD